MHTYLDKLYNKITNNKREKNSNFFHKEMCSKVHNNVYGLIVMFIFYLKEDEEEQYIFLFRQKIFFIAKIQKKLWLFFQSFNTSLLKHSLCLQTFTQ